MNVPIIHGRLEKDVPILASNPHANRLKAAMAHAVAVSRTPAFENFVEVVRQESPWRFHGVNELERFLHNVEHHLRTTMPRLLVSVDRIPLVIFDFGCGSGSGSIALTLLFPEAQCRGVDISSADVTIARARARLYGVDDRCEFSVIGEGQALPAPDDSSDLCICCSVLEYIIRPDVRRFCAQEMARVLVEGGLLFISVPNRIYPVELHSHKLGWNYFPKLLNAGIIGSTVWEIRRLARPHVLSMHRLQLLRLLTPWTNFCLKKQA